MSTNIVFIGAGNMAAAIIGGLVASGRDPAAITACDIDAAKTAALQDQFGILTATDSFSAAESADVVVLAVKPQVMNSVCEALAELPPNSEQLFVSIAAGVPMDAMQAWLGGERAIVRCMPNTPALLQLGASGLAANQRVSGAQRESAEAILKAVGIAIWVDRESDLDAVTAVSGSGPAYFFYFIELLENAGVELGLPRETAARLASQTALGAASMAENEDVVQLRANVTSKKGTTEQAILSFQADQLQQLVSRATAAAHRRSLELAAELTAK